MTGRRQGAHSHLGDPAFSLVEVVLALAVATLGIVAILALLPVGIKSTRDSLEETRAINVMSEVIVDRQATPLSLPSPFYQLSAVTNAIAIPSTNTFGITDNNQYVTQLSQALYRVDCVITPPVGGRLDPYHAWLKVSWPANSANPAGFVESVVTFPQP